MKKHKKGYTTAGVNLFMLFVLNLTREGEFIMKFNGQILQLNREIPLLQFVRENKYDLAKIAVELNGRIVPKAAYAEVILRDEDTLEVVNFVGGG